MGHVHFSGQKVAARQKQGQGWKLGRFFWPEKNFILTSPTLRNAQGKNFESNKNRERLKHKTEALLLFSKRFDSVSVDSIPFQFIRYRFSLFDSVSVYSIPFEYKIFTYFAINVIFFFNKPVYIFHFFKVFWTVWAKCQEQ